MIYNPELCDEGLVRGLVADYQSIVDGLARDPLQLLGRIGLPSAQAA
jgi:hypothetical protein